MKKLFCSKKHNRASESLYESLAALRRRICTEFVDPKSLESYIACRAITLDKNDGKGGIRPIGIGEIIRRVLRKAIDQIFGADICHAAGSQQTCAGEEGGVEAAIHAAREIFQMESTEANLLIDAENAFNRQTALLNIRHICPKISTYLINIYRLPARLILGEGVEILSQEGTTQGDNSDGILCAELEKISCQSKQNWVSSRVVR